MKKVFNCTTDLCVNLKTILRSDKRAKSGKSYLGILRRDEASEEFNFDEHYTFIEVLPTQSVGFQPTFSRHAKVQTSSALVIWLNANVPVPVVPIKI